MTTALKNAIKRDGRSLHALASSIGVDKGILSRFLRDDRTLTLKTADQICKGLGVDIQLVRNLKQRKKGR